MKLLLPLLTIVSSLLTTVMGVIPIKFIGKSKAKSTITDKGTTLYVKTTRDHQSGAQFPYTKQIKDPRKAGLVTVYLVANRTRIATLQTGFDAIGQSCSCYWLDAKELIVRFPTLKTKSNYRITMEGPKFRASSGTFGIDVRK